MHRPKNRSCSSPYCTNDFLVGAVIRTAPITVHSFNGAQHSIVTALENRGLYTDDRFCMAVRQQYCSYASRGKLSYLNGARRQPHALAMLSCKFKQSRTHVALLCVLIVGYYNGPPSDQRRWKLVMGAADWFRSARHKTVNSRSCECDLHWPRDIGARAAIYNAYVANCGWRVVYSLRASFASQRPCFMSPLPLYYRANLPSPEEAGAICSMIRALLPRTYLPSDAPPPG